MLALRILALNLPQVPPAAAEYRANGTRDLRVRKDGLTAAHIDQNLCYTRNRDPRFRASCLTAS
jgi:hypothetical protein